MSEPIGNVLVEALERIPSDAQAAIALERREQRYREQLETTRRQAWEWLLKQIGRRYDGCTLDSFEAKHEKQRTALQQLREYAADLTLNIELGRPIVLFGPVGTGKDHLLTAMLRLAIGKDQRVAWTDGLELFGQMRDGMNTNTSERRIIDPYTSAGVLGLSDPVPPSGTLSEYQAATLFRIVDRRYRDRLPTWVTINAANGDEAAARIGLQVVDRLRDEGLMISCNWESYRRRVRLTAGGLS